MQALRSLFTRTPAPATPETPAKPLATLEPHQLEQVAGGLPRIGGGKEDDPESNLGAAATSSEG